MKKKKYEYNYNRVTLYFSDSDPNEVAIYEFLCNLKNKKTSYIAALIVNHLSQFNFDDASNLGEREISYILDDALFKNLHHPNTFISHSLISQNIPKILSSKTSNHIKKLVPAKLVKEDDNKSIKNNDSTLKINTHNNDQDIGLASNYQSVLDQFK